MKNLHEGTLKGMLALLFMVTVAFSIACAPPKTVKPVMQSASVSSFVEPSLQAGVIKSVAIFPMRNISMQPNELFEINRSVTINFQKRNPKLKIMGPAESVSMMNNKGLAAKYSQFLGNYAQSGIPDVKILKEIGAALGIDAFLQGEVLSVKQYDAASKYYYGKTSLEVRYKLFSTSDGSIIWDASSRAFKLSEAGEPAPSIYDVVTVGQEKIIGTLPVLSQ